MEVIRAYPLGQIARSDEPEPEQLEEQPEPIDEACEACNWPDVCLKDKTCWKAVGAARERALAERTGRAVPIELESVATETPQVECSEPGCTTMTPARGRYAGRCAEHRAARLRLVSETCPQRGNRWTRETVIERLREWGAEHGHAPRQADVHRNPDLPSVSTVERLCGGWAEGVAAAGFPRPRRGKPVLGEVPRDFEDWTRETAIEAIKRWAAEHDGLPPISTDWRDDRPDGYPSLSQVRRLFGTWNKAITAAGLEIYQPGLKAPDQPNLRVRVVQGWIHVPGTGLVYRSPLEGYAAADELEERAERESDGLRVDGFDAQADVMLDRGRAQAELIRRSMRIIEERNGDSNGNGSNGHQPEPEPEQPGSSGIDPEVGLQLVAAARGFLDEVERILSTSCRQEQRG